MKFPALVLALVVLTTSVVACEESSPTAPAAPTFDPADLVGHWVRSLEEESSTEDPGVEWYRPADSRDFPPAWFRMAYGFRADGRCEYLWLSPVDAHEMRPGTWDFAADDPHVVRIFDDEGEELANLSFRIVTLDDELLRVERRR
jgi:hypothetical protein